LITLALLSAGSLALAQGADKEKTKPAAPEAKPAASAPHRTRTAPAAAAAARTTRTDES